MRNAGHNADHLRRSQCGSDPRLPTEALAKMGSDQRSRSAFRSASLGFTIVGVILSLALAAAVSVIIANLIARAEQVARVSRQKFVAINVAREGLELVRAVRDNNWMRDYTSNDQWLEGGLCEGSYGTGSHQFIIDPATVRNNNEVRDRNESGADPNLYVQPSGEWTHETILGQDPTYSRVMEIDCNAEDGDPPYVTVTSTVSWESRGESHNMQIKERLYNWRYVYE